MEPLGGLHHVTAITGDAPGNLRFYTGVLGLRLVKKSVNQDDVSAYHLFYADAKGSPGTDLTFFDWPATAPNQPGLGSIAPIGLRVAGDGALDWWEARFDALAVAHEPRRQRGGRSVLPFTDPEGQRLELVADGGLAGGLPWDAADVPAAHQIKGLDSVGLVSARPRLTGALLTEVLGFRPGPEQERPGGGVEQSLEVGPGGPGAEVRLILPADAGYARQGRGGVHHVALRVPDEQTQLEWRQAVLGAGLQTTPVIDRFYFKSVYFREPGGILIEIATDGPGFAADEPEATMGSTLALPPFLEGRRQEIEAGLQPL